MELKFDLFYKNMNENRLYLRKNQGRYDKFQIKLKK